MNEISRLEHELEHGKKIMDRAEDIWGWGTTAGKIRARRRADFFINLGKFTNQNTVLEIGCGTGLFTGMVFESTGANIIATDLVPELIQIASLKHPQIKFQVEDAMNLSFENQTFDGIYGSSILHHLDFEKSLVEMNRVLKSGGKFIFAEPNMLNPQILIQKNIPYIKEKLGDSPDETAIIRWKFKSMMEKYGFKNISITPYDFLHPYTPESLIPFVSKLGEIIESIPIINEIAGSVIIYGEKK